MADLTSMLQASAGAAGGAESDDDFANTVLLLHGDGTNGAQNNTFLDSSTNNFTITRNGNTTQGSFSPFSKPDGRWGNYFTDAGGDYFSLAANAALVPPTSSAFTVECWIYPTGSTANPIFNEVYTGGSNKIALAFNLGSAVGNTSGLYPWIGFYNGSAWSGVISNVAVNANEWSHIACVFTGSAVEIYINGSAVATTGTISTWTSVALGDGWRIGKSWTTGGELTGYLSNLRYVNGSAVYSGSFTPSGPLTAITNTVLLTCQSNRFVDNSTNNFAITAAGTPKVTPFSPFPLTTEYSPSVNGGSGYFDGSGDYLTITSGVTDQFDPGSAFTLECWVYVVGTSTTQYAFEVRGTTGDWNASTGIVFQLIAWHTDGNCKWQFKNGSPTSISGTRPPNNAWAHLCVGYDGTTTRFWLNGVSVGTSVAAYSPPTYSNVAIGSNVSATVPLNGYVGGLRFVKGTDIYGVSNTTITVPTTPFTAVSGTSLLCNFTNAGIYDNTGFNVLETVGNAQIDTTTKKYGTGSMEFDGTGDWLVLPSNNDFNFGSGNWTIEAWVYFTGTPGSSDSSYAIASKWDGSATNEKSFLLRLTSSTGTKAQILCSANGSTNLIATGSTSLSSGTWYHIAAVQNAGTVTLYVNGTSDATVAVSSVHTNNQRVYVGATLSAAGSPVQPLTGLIDDLRITKGVARYTTTFTPPTKAFPDL